jgi:UDP-3-O-[3-hydroxymyristoyl] glucosamine N-acyltransferase
VRAQKTARKEGVYLGITMVGEDVEEDAVVEEDVVVGEDAVVGEDTSIAMVAVEVEEEEAEDIKMKTRLKYQ